MIRTILAPSLAIGLGLALGLGVAGGAVAAQCGNGPGGFNTWVGQFKREAVAAGIRQRTVDQALAGVTYSKRVIGYDRNQKSFKLSFDQFWARRVNNAMIQRGRSFIRDNRVMMSSIEQRYGVPSALVVAVWALETGFGSNNGNLPIIRSLATLSYDCRRSEFFTAELMAALKIIDRGDMRANEMVGAWAGEIGQTQFLAERYLNYAVDYDGNGKRDLMRSVPDVLASTANWFSRNGWQRGQPWGPGTANYNVIGKWNRADVYKQTIARLASEIAQ
ncbi:lytic transglycosylase domain-containing protein [Acuticoccus sp. I52.16.1]|uniref:lytic murein transglycosylase n=1 Tax=Acuticoccus sp. I52.16.1 TaxID=2928472 RepID=UPI001FD08AD4|nr:lytic murein transglycosylase [Acuticoccus sp. I52.16.1]UOM35994.1 lytic murein transglycosylase [Acuticoccus sp. I52.16.1]